MYTDTYTIHITTPTHTLIYFSFALNERVYYRKPSFALSTLRCAIIVITSFRFPHFFLSFFIRRMLNLIWIYPSLFLAACQNLSYHIVILIKTVLNITNETINSSWRNFMPQTQNNGNKKKNKRKLKQRVG